MTMLAYECLIAGSKTGSIGQLYGTRKTVYVICDSPQSVNEAAIRAAYRLDLEHVIVARQLRIGAMAPTEAWQFAATWGSYMTAGDPGACMYGFSEDFKMQSEEHREACFDWITKCEEIVKANPGDYESDELANLARFRAACLNAECAE